MMPSTNLLQDIQEAIDRLDNTGGELVLDLSRVERIDSAMVRALEALACRADEKKIQVMLNAVNVEVYRVLKLVKLAPRFSFGVGGVIYAS